METNKIIEKLNTLESRVNSIEHILNEREVLLVNNEDMERAKVFLELTEKHKGEWKDTNSAVEEVKRMRKYRGLKDGY